MQPYKMKKLSILAILTFLLIPLATTKAAEVVYQKLVDFRGDMITVQQYGTINDNYYSFCNIDAWSCRNVGTSTINLFPEFAEKETYFSSDHKLVAVADYSSTTATYQLFDLTKTPAVFVKTLNFNKNIQKAVFSRDDSKIVFIIFKELFSLPYFVGIEMSLTTIL